MLKVECQVPSLAKAEAPILDFDVGDSSRSAVQDLMVPGWFHGPRLSIFSNLLAATLAIRPKYFRMMIIVVLLPESTGNVNDLLWCFPKGHLLKIALPLRLHLIFGWNTFCQEAW